MFITQHFTLHGKTREVFLICCDSVVLFVFYFIILYRYVCLQRVLNKRIDDHMNSLTESDDKDSHENQEMQDVNRKNVVSKIQYLFCLRKSVQ